MTRPDDFLDSDRAPDVSDPGFTDDIVARIRRRVELGGIAPPTPAPARVPRPPEETNGARPVRPTRAEPAGAATTSPPQEPRGEAPAGLDDDEDPGEAAETRPKRSARRNAIEWIAVAAGALIVAFLIRAFLLQAFYIPSESMEPTLYKQDRILVNKLSYKLHDVNRGDLIVFEKPPNEPSSDIKDLIKRVIALGGETIEQRGSQIYIDDRLLSEPYLADGQAEGPDITWVDGCANPTTETNKCTIPEGSVWVMGDNRDQSHDSRYFGPIDEDLIVGRAFIKVWPLNKIGFL